MYKSLNLIYNINHKKLFRKNKKFIIKNKNNKKA